MSNENTNQTDTQTTAAEKETYPCACSHCGCTSDGFSEDDEVCQDCGRGNHEYTDAEKGITTP